MTMHGQGDYNLYPCGGVKKMAAVYSIYSNLGICETKLLKLQKNIF